MFFCLSPLAFPQPKGEQIMSFFHIRPEIPTDYDEVEFLTREAFWNVYRPGCDEHLIVHSLRGSDQVLTALNHVAVSDGRIIGHIFYTRGRVIAPDGSVREVSVFGPISVHPDVQRRGVGSALIRHTLALAAQLGFGGVAIEGNPAYYHRFGFTDAQRFGILTAEGKSMPELMAQELRPGGLDGVTGCLHFAPQYFPDPQALEIFEQRFPHKEKRCH